MLSLVIFSLFVGQAHGAVHSQPFVHYFDCLRATQTPLVDIDVFMKVHGKPQKHQSKASAYIRGVDVNLLLDDDNAMIGLEFGGRASQISFEDLKSGLKFGVLGKTMHTIELDEKFDPRKGGKLIIGYLTEISIGSVFRSLIRSVYLQEPDYDVQKAQKQFQKQKIGLSESLHQYRLRAE